MASELRVLVADDDAIARRFLESTLRKAGYAVAVASSGDEAWRILSSQDVPTIAILDWMMPDLTGVEICEKVRAASLPMAPYLIVLTSRSEPGDVVEALGAGADDHITKPFEIAELRARLAVGVRIVTLQQQLTERVHSLEEALAHVQQLQGLIPICAWCRQVRNDGNFWEQVDSYLTKRSGLQFTHAICPTCRDREVARARDSRPT
jgi:DNA-binding response OmpR family regulator